jgi:hypothetical protein
MEDVNISKFRAQVVRSGSTPASPGFVVSEGQNPVDPSGSGQIHLPVTIATASTGLSITESQILSGAGLVSQYIRGDGSLADFPATTGGGSSVSYYLNGSVSQGTIGGVAYKELNKTPIFGAGTDITISADGYIASFITDAGDPNKLLIPAGNWNLETYFSASSNGGSPSFYVELYKYNGTTFTLIATSSSAPELIAFGTNLNPYFSTLAVPETVLALTDRLALRYYVTHSGRTITLHTENNHLCQVITTFTTGLTALNGLTSQVQYLTVGTSGTDFAISSVTDTHTFNLPTASATNRGALSSADWTTFNNKTSNLGTVTSVGLSSATSGVTIGSTPITTSGTITLAIATASGSQNGLLSSTDWTTFNNKASTADLANYLPLAGGTMTGQLISSFNNGGEPYVNAVFRGVGGNNIGGILTNGTIQAHIRFLVGSNTWDGAGAKQWQIRVGNGNSEDNLKIYSWTYGNDVATFLADATVRLHKYTTNGFVKFGSSNGTLEVDTNVYYLASNPSGFTSNTGTVTSVGLSSATSGVTIGSTPVTTSGTITLAIATASGSQNGLLSSTDWTTFNSKQNALTNPVTGTGTTNYLPKFTGASSIGNSNLQDSGSLVTVGVAATFLAGTNRITLANNFAATGNTSSPKLSFFSFGDTTTYPVTGPSIQKINTSSFGAGRLAFFQHEPSDFTNETEVVSIFSDGNLLIGTSATNAGFKLDVNGTGRFSGALTGTSAIFSSSVTAGGSFISSMGNNATIFSSSAATTGYQTISLANSGAQLVVGINNSAGSFLTNSLAYSSFITTGLGSTSLQLGTNNSIKMSILSGGNVGIGLNNPSSLLHISGPNNDVSGNYYSQLKINGTGTYPDNIAGLSFENGGVQQHIRFIESGVPKLQIRYNAGNTIDNRLKYYSFITNTDFITFNGNNGNVLIGTDTDPGYKLRVNGTTFTNDIRTFLPEADSVSTPWRFGTASIATITPNRRLRVNVGGVEYYIGAVEV